ncbi:LysE family translocator [bacterium]|nr:LysE family translocator [bacterium]
MEYLTLALTLGLSAGFSPGPLMTVIISEAIRHGRKEGLKVAMAPLITDLPIVTFVLVVLSQLQDFDWILGCLALLGSGYLFYLGLGNIRFKGMEVEIKNVTPRSIRKGIITNFLSPNPYLFWFSILGPNLIKAYQTHIGWAIGFLFIFYVLLLGGKFTIALIAAESRRFLKSKGYIYSFRVLGCILWIFSIIFLKNALHLLGVI